MDLPPFLVGVPSREWLGEASGSGDGEPGMLDLLSTAAPVKDVRPHRALQHLDAKALPERMRPVVLEVSGC